MSDIWKTVMTTETDEVKTQSTEQLNLWNDRVRDGSNKYWLIVVDEQDLWICVRKRDGVLYIAARQP